MSRLAAGLKSVRESQKRAQSRLAALHKREDVLFAKVGKAGDDDVDEQHGKTVIFAKAELAKIHHEQRALDKKIQTCRLNDKCIVAEMEIVADLAASADDDIQFERPIVGRVTSGFGMRMHPLDHTEKAHQGLDLAGSIGDAVKCTANGRVIFAGVQRGYGNVIVVQHSDSLTSAYGHLSRIGVVVGQAVAQGEKIGEVGMTGNSTGPHLHFEIRENGEPVDPSKYL